MRYYRGIIAFPRVALITNHRAQKPRRGYITTAIIRQEQQTPTKGRISSSEMQTATAKTFVEL